MYLAPVPKPSDESLAKNWEHAALKYQPYFEVQKVAALQNIFSSRNIDPIRNRAMFTKLDTLQMRQQLGEISKAEVKEVNRVFWG